MANHDGIKGLYLKKGWYYFQPPTPKEKGARRPGAVALGTQDLVTAIQKLEEKRHELLEWQSARRRTLDEVLPRYYKAKETDSILTRRQREVVLSGFSEILGNPRLESITTEMIHTWREHVEKHGATPEPKTETPPKDAEAKEKSKQPVRRGPRSPTTVKTYTIVVKAFFNWAVEEKLIAESPMKRMKRQTTVAKTKVQEFLTEEEREVLLAADAPKHVRFILFMGFFAGLRDGEMLAMTPRWIWISPEGDRGTITVQNEPIIRTDKSHDVWKPKVREIRTIPIHPRLLEFLKDYGLDPERDENWEAWRTLEKPRGHSLTPWMLKPEKPYWPAENLQSKRYAAHKALNTLAKRCGIKNLNYHILRHSFATHLVMKGVSLADVAGLLGDTLKVTEETYAGYSPNKANPLAVL